MNTKRLNIKLDPETHKALKMETVKQATSIQEFIVHLIKQVVYPIKKA